MEDSRLSEAASCARDEHDEVLEVELGHCCSVKLGVVDSSTIVMPANVLYGQSYMLKG